MMKTFASILTGLVAGLSSTALVHAADYQLGWAMSAMELQGRTYRQLKLDISETPRFYRVNGVLQGDSALQQPLPVSGTCLFDENADQVLCALPVAGHELEIRLDTTLNGQVSVLSPEREVQQEVYLYFTGISQ